MRYLGNKTKLLSFIDKVIDKYQIKGNVFGDLFSGTCSVGDHFKDRFQIISNDYMYFSKVISGAKLLNSKKPDFTRFITRFGSDPFVYFNSKVYLPEDHFFIYHNYTPKGGRKFFTESNALKIDGIRIDTEEAYKNGYLLYKEYLYVLASLLESSLRVSNTSGTYQAFFKFWESRSLKPLTLEPLEFNEVPLKAGSQNVLLNEDTNLAVRHISGDIAYIDPPYTTTQYTNMYHVLETIARYDYPQLFGKTGRRVSRSLSGYSNKQMVAGEFEDLFRQLDFEDVLISYSNQSLIPLDEMVSLASKFAVCGVVHVEKFKYREYATNNLSYKDDGDGLNEAIIYFKKDRAINKSPLNYSGSKDEILPSIIKELPKHLDVFVDAMGGAFNVGANIVAMDRVVYNEYNPFIFGIVKMLVNKKRADIVKDTKTFVSTYGLHKKDKDAYLKLRNFYNVESNNPSILFTLQIYAFQNIIRFNSSMKMNTPVGNNEYNSGTEERILNFRSKTPKVQLFNKKYQTINMTDYPEDTVFYFDPPYFLTTAEYNDGKRGFDGWDADKETELLDFLARIDASGRKFILSNVLQHNGKKHHMLEEWIKQHGYHVVVVGQTGIKYPRTEVLVMNYDIKGGY